MPEFLISGIPVNFPFEPYDLQMAYMEKVIDCLETGKNGVLESPTGTGKTLSLLCSSLAWILQKKSTVQTQIKNKAIPLDVNKANITDDLFPMPNSEVGNGTKWSVPKIIYASRTHSQLTQAMQELKQTSYSFMRSVVLGSRDQLCIHPEVIKEVNNSSKIQMCKLRIASKSCSFHSRIESKKEHPDFKGPPIMDIEDLVQVGRKLKMCPYYASKELLADSDITFMPYNYLLDPKARKANKVDLNNTIIILDEAHNVEKLCEDSASVTIKSSDIAMAIDDVTHIMKALAEETIIDSGDEAKDFTLDDLALLKEMLMELEKGIDNIAVNNIAEGTTYPAGFIFELLGGANITSTTKLKTLNLLDKLIQFLANQTQNSALRKGNSFLILSDLITIVFSSKDEDMGKVFKSFKVHVQIEETKQQKTYTKKDNWITPKNATISKAAKIIHYWCFNPGFGMDQLLNKNIRSIILTSGTLAPLKPLIAELGIPIKNRLENPHIVTKSQVCVKIVSFGPDKEPLISNYQNRDNPKYINSLGRTIQTLCPVIPDGLLVFFPSYPLMNKCVDSWQQSGIWSNICRYKPVYVEPRNKESFTTTMTEFYETINDPKTKGACFMAVCRGKVSEGLDFADINGRAVIITGLPFPPLKDPRVVLKRKYLEENRTKENELLSGQNWYALEATRAVNQAIGRVIRHRNDYGAILLCDSRFNNPNQITQLSSWVQEHLKGTKQHSSFGPIIADLSRFFKNAEKSIVKPNLRKVETLVESNSCDSGIESTSSKSCTDTGKNLEAKNKYKLAFDMANKVEKSNSIVSWTPEDYKSATGNSNEKTPCAKDFLSRLEGNVSTLVFNNVKTEPNSESNSLVNIHKRERLSSNNTTPENDSIKKKRFKLVNNSHISTDSQSSSSQSSQFTLTPIKFPYMSLEKSVPAERGEFLKLIKNSITEINYSKFVKILFSYQKDDNFDAYFQVLAEVFSEPCLQYLLKAMRRFVKDNHKHQFDSLILHFK